MPPAALLVRSRWVLLPQLLAFLAGVELGRLALDVPSLAIRFDNVYGVIAFVITRGVHLVLLVVPMATGVAAGILLAERRVGTDRPARRLPLGTALLGVATVALIALVAWPASTPPVVDEAGNPVDGAIAELATVRLGGTDQAVLIRAADPDAPVLLYLSGGPGQSDLALGRVLSDPWVNDFVVVDLDQRGNGKSYAAIDPRVRHDARPRRGRRHRAHRLPARAVRRAEDLPHGRVLGHDPRRPRRPAATGPLSTRTSGPARWRT